MKALQNGVKQSWFEKAIEMDFNGRNFCVPQNYDEILRVLYGDYMQLPPEDKRITHGARLIKSD